jgi:hypothetical protein
MAVPLLMLYLCVSFYQWTFFPIYGIAKVRRGDYIVFDRHDLSYLNFIKRFHCTYCEYGTGLVAYVGEIIARTEQYFCPIKHAHKFLGTHARYNRFLAYGDAEAYEARLEEFRVAPGRHAMKSPDHRMRSRLHPTFGSPPIPHKTRRLPWQREQRLGWRP